MPTHANHTARPSDAPFLGVGVGLRPAHYGVVLERAERRSLVVDWFEALSENYMMPGGRPLRVLADLRRHAPVVLHGVSMNLGSVDPLDGTYLQALSELIRRVEPIWVSDHLCWTGVDGRNLHDLIPLPGTEEALRHVSRRIGAVQERLGRRIAVENVSSYIAYTGGEMTEWEFLAAVASEADCGILLDVNNVFVNAHNHDFEAKRYIDALPPERVFQIHLAGHSRSGPLLIDSHDHPIPDPVLTLYERAIRRLGPVSTLIEWDDQIPDFDQLEAEALRVRTVLERVRREKASGGDDNHGNLRSSSHAAAALAAHHSA